MSNNKPKTHDNAPVRAFLAPYSTATELCTDHPAIDDLFSGVLALKTAGDTATRSLSRSTLFHILQRCPAVTVEGVKEATTGRYAQRSNEAYAACARVASKALAGFIAKLPPVERPRLTIRQEQEALDAPYHAELRALGLM